MKTNKKRKKFMHKYDPSQRNSIHYFEATIERRARLGGYVHGQAFCGTGDAHQTTTRMLHYVTCTNCLQSLRKKQERGEPICKS